MIRLFWLPALALAACGLVSDATTVKLHLPAKDFAVDTADWHLTTTAQTVPSIPCSVNCTNSAAQLCSGSCSADCEQATNSCEAEVPVTLKNDYNLATDAPEYGTIASYSFISVTVDDIFFDITSNTLNLDTPQLTVVIGPQTINGANDSGAQIIGTIPVVHAGQTGRVDVIFAPNGRAVLKQFMDDFHTPFRVLVTGTETVHGGQSTPAGKLTGSVQADAHASLGG